MPAIDIGADVRKFVQDRTKKNLLSAREEANKELQEIGTTIANRMGCRVQFGPMKTEASALRKLKDDYSAFVPEGDWFEMKDLVRLTLLGKNFEHTNLIAKEVIRYCGAGTSEILNSQGREVGRSRAVPGPAGVRIDAGFSRTAGKPLSLMKAEKVDLKDVKNPCGYSGWNFAVRLRNGSPCEIQLNIPEVLYGKGPKKEFCMVAGQAEWDRISRRYQIESSLCHALYEIWRADKTGDNGLEAAALCKKYLDYLRGEPNFFVARELQEKLTDFKTKNKSARNKDGFLFHWDEPTPFAYFTRRSGWSFHSR